MKQSSSFSMFPCIRVLFIITKEKEIQEDFPEFREKLQKV